MTNILILTRHGAYDREKGKPFDRPLAPEGEGQILDVAEQLIELPTPHLPQRIYYSESLRTTQSAAIFAAAFTNAFREQFAARAGRDVAVEPADWLREEAPVGQKLHIAADAGNTVMLVTHENNIRSALFGLVNLGGGVDPELLTRRYAPAETFVFRQAGEGADDWTRLKKAELLHTLAPR